MLMAVLFDTHAHLDQSEFDDDRTAVIARAADAGVGHVVAIGTTAASSRTCVDLARQFATVFAAVGIQPNCVAEGQPEDWDRITTLVDEQGVVAIGETGLDRHWDYTPWEMQQDYFDRHLRLAQERDLPVVIHMRDCEDEIMTMLREARRRGPLRGIMHSFTGDDEMARECVELGLHISFAGMVTFKKSTALRACAANVPADRILIETDSPYLSPEPVRKVRRNEPAHVRHTAACLAEVRQVDEAEFARQTTENACRLFGVPDHDLRQ